MGSGLLGYIWRGPIDAPRRRGFSLDQSEAGRRGFSGGRRADRTRDVRKAKRRAQKRARY